MDEWGNSVELEELRQARERIEELELEVRGKEIEIVDLSLELRRLSDERQSRVEDIR